MNFQIQLQMAQVFLVAMTILGVALADARNEKLKTALSIVGLILAAGWIICLLDSAPAPGDPKVALRVMIVIAVTSLGCWGASLLIHGLNWSRKRDPEAEKRQAELAATLEAIASHIASVGDVGRRGTTAR